jgi:hypothetical protein
MDPLVARFESLLETGPASDWLDVRRRARRSRRPVVLAAAAVILFVAVPAVAIAVRSGVLPWGDAEPASPAVVERFAAHDRAVREFTDRQSRHGSPVELGILAGEARAFALPEGATAFVAPTRSGGYFAFLENPRDPIGAIDYRLGENHSGPAIASGSHRVTDGSWWVSGHAEAQASSSVEIVLDDGSILKPPVTWIGPPIDAGLFLVRLGPGRHAVAVVLRDEDANELARDAHLGAAYDQMQEMLERARQGRLPTRPGAGSAQPGAGVEPSG